MQCFLVERGTGIDSTGAILDVRPLHPCPEDNATYFKTSRFSFIYNGYGVEPPTHTSG